MKMKLCVHALKNLETYFSIIIQKLLVQKVNHIPNLPDSYRKLSKKKKKKQKTKKKKKIIKKKTKKKKIKTKIKKI